MIHYTRPFVFIACGGAALIACGAFAGPSGAQAEPSGAQVEPPAVGPSLGLLSYWDDGFAEMCYYDATDTIYGKKRKYTRVQIVVREWFDPHAGVKTDKIDSPTAVPVLKLNICEQVPTENYNYRYMVSLFSRRSDLRPLKLVCSSQEWCGTTYQHLRWDEKTLRYRSFSYFEREAERDETFDADMLPFESLYLIARDLAGGTQRGTVANVFPAVRSSHASSLKAVNPIVELSNTTERLKVPAGAFDVRRVVFRFDDKPFTFWVETESPYRLIKYDFGSQSGELRFVEHRAYWDRNWSSGFHKPEDAP